MLIVVSFDTVFFSVIAFWNYDTLKTIVVSGLISKGVFAIYYSLFFYVYLKYIEIKDFKSNYFTVRDVFQKLSYKQKYENISRDAIKATEEIKKKDIKYKTLTNNSPVGIFHTRSDGYTTFVNARWSEISGISFSEALGYGWLKAVHPGDIKPTQEEWNLAVKQQRMSKAEYRFLLPDHSVRWVLGNAVPEVNSQNEIIGFVGTITDITEIKLYQQEQTRLKEKAEESDRLKTTFLQNISHEIRTPLNAISGFSGLLDTPNLSGDKRQMYTQIIRQSSDQLLGIVSDILTISMLETKQEQIKISKVCINEIIDELYAVFLKQVVNKNISLHSFKTLSDTESVIFSDKIKITQILSNLLSNALKFTDEGLVEYGYELKSNAETYEMEFFVKDSGIGIKPEYHDKIFERFAQSETSIQLKYGGTGLGLSISKGLVELLGGKIWMESEPGKGSTFYFKIPIKNIY
jgi:PAS domain S-box-containing protein